MSLQELVKDNSVAVVDREAPRTEPGTYTPDADAYGLFCEQYLEKPTLSEEEAGKAVASILKNKKEAELVVIHDDIDMPLGKIKFSKDSGAGGHKGVNSIINSLGKQDFIRLKIGICPATKKPEAVEKFVIEKFTKEELLVLNKVIETSANALKLLINEDLKKT